MPAGKSAITYAAGRGFALIVRRLLEAGVDAKRAYGNDLTALMWAAGYEEGVGARSALEVRRARARCRRAHRRGRQSRPHRADDRGRARPRGDRRAPARARRRPRDRGQAAESAPPISPPTRACARCSGRGEPPPLLPGDVLEARHVLRQRRDVVVEIASIRSVMPGLLPRARVRKSSMVCCMYSLDWPARRGCVPSPW